MTSDDYAVLDLLDALVRKSLLVADRSSGRTRFSMLETIRQFAEEQLVAGGEAHRGPDRPCSLLRRARSRHPGPVGQPPPARGLRLVHRRAGQSAHRVPVGRRPRRPRRRRHHRHLCGVPRPVGRQVRADRLGRRAHRARPRRRPSPARGSVRDGVAVLPGRTDRGRCPLQRRRSDGGDRQRERRGAVRHRGLARHCVRGSSASPNGRSSGAAPNSHAVATPIPSPGHPWFSHWRSPVAPMRRWPPRAV